MACLAIYLLGRIEVHLDSRAIPGLEASKPGALLAYLAVEWPGLQSRQALAGLLWPERTEQEALSSLRFALSNLRTALDDRQTGSPGQVQGPFLLVDRHQVGLNPQADIWVDVRAFEQQAADCDEQAGAGKPSSLQALRAALDLYRGSFLEGLAVDGSPAFEGWLRARREQLERRQVHLSHLLAAACEQAGHWREAEEAYRAVLALHPWDEATQRRLMRMLERSGQRGAALAQYEACRQSLYAELGVEPEGETTLLYHTIKRRVQGELDGPAPPVLDAPPISPVSPRLPLSVPSSPPLNTTTHQTGMPFVARQRELQRLETALERALGGQGQVALVTGEAGSGKTALLSEFGRRALDRRPDLLVVGGRCNAYSGLGQPYLPFIECVQMLAGEWDPLPWANSLEQEHQRRLQAALPWMAQSLVETAPLLLERFVDRAALVQRIAQAPGARPDWLKGLRPGTGQLGARRMAAPLEAGALFEQITRLLAGVTRHNPLILLVDDLQWVDPGSAALLFHLVRRSTASRVLIAAAYRPCEVTAWPETGEHPLAGVAAELRHLPGSLMIDLDQSDEHVFVSAFLEKDPLLQPQRLDEDFCRALARRTGGNPLFTAELLRHLQAIGGLQRASDGAWVSSPNLNWQRLPEHLEAAIAGRMAHLPGEWVDWLSTASVEGESFTAEVLARVHGVDEPALLRDLSGPLNVVRGSYRLLQFEGVQWLGSQRLSRYRFRHALFQTYLYEQLDPAERSRRHAAVGQALEALYAPVVEQPGRYAGELARHFEAAGLAEQAAAYWLQTGQNAQYLTAASTAIASFRHGLALLDGLPPAPDAPARDRLEMRLQMGLAAALTSATDWGGTGRWEALQRALALARRSSEGSHPPELFPLLYGQVEWLIARDSIEQALEVAVQMLGAAGYCRAAEDHRAENRHAGDCQAGAQPSLSLALACWAAGLAHLFRAELPAARQYLARALEVYEAAGQPPTLPLIGNDLGVVCRAFLGLGTALAGYIDQAWELFCQVRQRAGAFGKGLTLGGTLLMAGEVAFMRGDMASLYSLAAEMQQLGQQHSMPYIHANGVLMQGEVELMAAEPGSLQARSAVDVIQRGMQINRDSGVQVGFEGWHERLAKACLKAGQIEAGLEVAAEGLRRVGLAGGPRIYAAELYRVQGELLLAAGHPQTDPREVEAWFQRARQASRQGGALMHELRAAMSLARLWQGERPAEAHSLLAEVYGRFTEGWGCPDLQEARALLEALAVH